jgi:hypothetical protein
MNLQKNKLWVAISLGLLSGPVFAAPVDTTCTVTPVNSIITEGQTLQLQADCGAVPLKSINWLMDGVSVTGDVAGAYPASTPIYYTTPVGLGGSNAFVFSVTGTTDSTETDDPSDSDGAATTSASATVVVKPSSAVVAKAADAANMTPTTPVDAQCGTADGGFVTEMPTNGEKCDHTTGTPALWVTGPTGFTWSCLSLNGGAEANCSATRGFTVTASAGAHGSVSPLTQGVAAGGTVTVTATPDSGYGTSWSSTCGSGSANGNSYTTSAVNANCTVTASFAEGVPGDCGSAHGTWSISEPAANLCDAGSSTSVTAGTNAFTWTCTGVGTGAPASCSAPRAYTVTATATGGTVSPASKNAAYNGTAQFTVTPDTTGHVASAGGTCPTGTLSGTTYTTGQITASCTVSFTFAAQTVSTTDPGIGKGLWVPPSMSTRTVADQSGGSADKVSYVPGCLNGAMSSNSSSGCSAKTSFDGTIYGTSTAHTVTFGGTGAANSGKQLVLRYKTTSTAGTSTKYIRTRNYDGGNVGVNMRVWLSADPTATYASVATACKQTSTRTPMVITGPGYCPISPNTVYYYGMEYDETGARRFQVDEGGADFL